MTARLHDAPESPADYLRSARRLRRIYGHCPSQLHRSLKNLSQARDRSSTRRLSDTIDPARSIPTSVSAGPASVFAMHVASYLECGTLRYSRRLALLREADRRGIERFEANLIIAAVQHRAGHPPRERAPRPERRPFPGALAILAAFVFVQSAILVAGYTIFFT